MGQLFRRIFQIVLVILENDALIRFLEIESESISVHQRLATIFESRERTFQELGLDPRNSVHVLQLRHVFINRFGQFVFQFKRVVVIYVSIAVVQEPGEKIELIHRTGPTIGRTV